MRKGFMFGCGFLIAIVILLGGCAVFLGVSTVEEGSPKVEKDKDRGDNNGVNTSKKEGKNNKKDDNIKYVSVKDSCEIDGIKVTVNSAEYTDERNEFEDDVDKVVKLNVTYVNNSDEDIPVGDGFDLYSNGKKVNGYAVDGILFDGISPGRTIDGNLGFGIKGEAKDLELEYSPTFSFTNQKCIYKLKL